MQSFLHFFSQDVFAVLAAHLPMQERYVHPIVYFTQVASATFAPRVRLAMQRNVSLSTGVGVGDIEAVFPGPVSS
jgi:hypothetical protein